MVAHSKEQSPMRLLRMIGRDPSIFKFNRLNIDTFQLFFTNLRYIL